MIGFTESSGPDFRAWLDQVGPQVQIKLAVGLGTESVETMGPEAIETVSEICRPEVYTLFGDAGMVKNVNDEIIAK